MPTPLFISINASTTKIFLKVIAKVNAIKESKNRRNPIINILTNISSIRITKKIVRRNHVDTRVLWRFIISDTCQSFSTDNKVLYGRILSLDIIECGTNNSLQKSHRIINSIVYPPSIISASSNSFVRSQFTGINALCPRSVLQHTANNRRTDNTTEEDVIIIFRAKLNFGR